MTADKHESTILDAIMRVVESQLQDNDPPEARLTLERLMKGGLAEKEAKKLIRGVAAIEICNIMENKEPFQHQRYVEALKKLPISPGRNDVDKIEGVSLTLKANTYFDGKVVSHTVHTQDGAKKTVGLIYPGTYKFDTGAPERMDIVAGDCRVKQSGETSWKNYKPGESFDVPGKSYFEIAVDKGIAEYLCSFK